ncbi:MAG TPA: ABC transporter permease [Chitinophagaceae bacterium]|nr:ABC transporter permease [Chitinophagaceae bacterium]
MFSSYFKTALRILRKNKGFSLLNLVGLSLGMACAVLILLWVYDEVSYNRFHRNYDNLYQVMENQHYDGKTYTFAALPGPFAPAIKQELPEIEYAARTDWSSMALFSLGDKAIYERGYYADPDFLRMFSFKLKKGDANILNDPTSLIITEEMAEKFFGKSDPVGKTLKVNNDKLYTVKGIVETPPRNSSIRFSWLTSFQSYEQRNEWVREWGNNGIQSFVQLKKGADPAQVDKKLYDFIQKKDSGALARPFLLSVDDWRLRSRFEEGKRAGGRITYVRLFSFIALLIIIIACINFMNLATARSEQRAREVGVRKVMGAGRRMLMRQFMSESIIMAFVAMVLAALIVLLVLPPFNTLVEKELAFSFSNPIISIGLPALALVCGLLAGSYPSFYLSSFNPINIFRGLRTGPNSSVTIIRKGLVVTQFVISIGLIICTIIIFQQIQHIKSRQLGYDKENVILVPLRGKMNERFATIRQELLNTGMIRNAAAANSRVLDMGSSSEDFRWQGKDPKSQVLITMEWVSPEYISTMQMKLKSGRDFYPVAEQDSTNIIINETFAGIIGKENPVGTVLTRDDGRQLTIVGVVKDFLFNDMYKKPDPLVLFSQPRSTNRMLVSVKAGQNMQQALAKIETVLDKHNPGYPFEYRFMDDEFSKLFTSEMMIGRLSRLFAILTIVISCLGLFGLAAYTAERRTKEIGIRKVLGASLSNVVTLLSKDFLRLVALAAVIAFPVAWWFMHQWLQGYAYRVGISWWVFGAAGVLAVIIALCTVSFQAVKAGLSNPVKSLRTE